MYMDLGEEAKNVAEELLKLQIPDDNLWRTKPIIVDDKRDDDLRLEHPRKHPSPSFKKDHVLELEEKGYLSLVPKFNKHGHISAYRMVIHFR